MTKFQIGDTIVDNNYSNPNIDVNSYGPLVVVVIGIKDSYYETLDEEGNIYSLDFDIENNFSLICPNNHDEINVGFVMDEYEVLGIFPGSKYMGHKCPKCNYCR